MASIKSSISLNSIDNGGRDRMGSAARRASGEIHVIVCPMFAGKTTALLGRINLEGNNGRNVAIIKSSKDTQYAIDSAGLMMG